MTILSKKPRDKISHPKTSSDLYCSHLTVDYATDFDSFLSSKITDSVWVMDKKSDLLQIDNLYQGGTANSSNHDSQETENFFHRRQSDLENSLNPNDIAYVEGRFDKFFEILLELLILIFTIVDMIFVAILVYRHYMSETEELNDPLQAWAMLLPLLLSTFGVQLFFERYPPERHWYNEFLNVPLLGPIFCTGELLYAKLQPPGKKETIRIEEESIKLKQYESIFRAFPEGIVMLTVLLIHRKEDNPDHIQSWIMETICIIFAIVGLAESHWYGIVSDFYRIHDKGKLSPFNNADKKRPHKLRVWQKLLLFLHALFAIGLRVFCEGLIRAIVFFAMNPKLKPGTGIPPHHSLAEVLLIVFFGETFLRLLCHLVAQILAAISTDFYNFLMNPFFQFQNAPPCNSSTQSLPTSRNGYQRIDTRVLDGTTNDGVAEFIGIHGAVKHGLLATVSPLQFQSKCLPTVLWFYIENLIFLLVWYVLTRLHEFEPVGGGGATSRPATFHIYDNLLLILAIFLFLISTALQGAVSYLTFPNSDLCVVRLKRVLHANLPE